MWGQVGLRRETSDVRDPLSPSVVGLRSGRRLTWLRLPDNRGLQSFGLPLPSWSPQWLSGNTRSDVHTTLRAAASRRLYATMDRLFVILWSAPFEQPFKRFIGRRSYAATESRLEIPPAILLRERQSMGFRVLVVGGTGQVGSGL